LTAVWRDGSIILENAPSIATFMQLCKTTSWQLRPWRVVISRKSSIKYTVKG
jgi:hypothetical protein